MTLRNCLLSVFAAAPLAAAGCGPKPPPNTPPTGPPTDPLTSTAKAGCDRVAYGVAQLTSWLDSAKAKELARAAAEATIAARPAELLAAIESGRAECDALIQAAEDLLRALATAVPAYQAAAQGQRQEAAVEDEANKKVLTTAAERWAALADETPARPQQLLGPLAAGGDRPDRGREDVGRGTP